MFNVFHRIDVAEKNSPLRLFNVALHSTEDENQNRQRARLNRDFFLNGSELSLFLSIVIINTVLTMDKAFLLLILSSVQLSVHSMNYRSV